MVSASEADIRIIQTHWNVRNDRFKDDVIAKLRRGWDIEEFYNVLMERLTMRLIIPISMYYFIITTIGIIMSTNPCTLDYCYHVNQYLWIWYGCVGLGLNLALVSVGYLQRWGWDTSPFMNYFSLTFGSMSQIVFIIQDSFAVPIVGIIVNIYYLANTSYLGPMLGMMIGANLAITLSAYFSGKEVQKYILETIHDDVSVHDSTAPFVPSVSIDILSLKPFG